jgi:hypothetical protein
MSPGMQPVNAEQFRITARCQDPGIPRSRERPSTLRPCDVPTRSNLPFLPPSLDESGEEGPASIPLINDDAVRSCFRESGLARSP